MCLRAARFRWAAPQLSVFGGSADRSTPPAYVTNPSAFGFSITDGSTMLRPGASEYGSGRRSESGARIDGYVRRPRDNDYGNHQHADHGGRGRRSGGHSQAFAIGLCTVGWRDQAAATYNLNLLAAQPPPATDGFAGIAFGFRNGSLYMVAMTMTASRTRFSKSRTTPAWLPGSP